MKFHGVCIFQMEQYSLVKIEDKQMIRWNFGEAYESNELKSVRQREKIWCASMFESEGIKLVKIEDFFPLL